MPTLSPHTLNKYIDKSTRWVQDTKNIYSSCVSTSPQFTCLFLNLWDPFCRAGWPSTCHRHASVSFVLGLQLYSIALANYAYFGRLSTLLIKSWRWCNPAHTLLLLEGRMKKDKGEPHWTLSWYTSLDRSWEQISSQVSLLKMTKQP